MQTETLSDTRAELTAPKTKDHLSPDGKWRSFPRVPNLLQYVRTQQYFARVKVNGKLIRRTLETDNFASAKLRLHDFIKEEKELATAEPFTFKALRLKYEGRIDSDPTLKAASKHYRKFCVACLLKSWRGIDELRAHRITEDECRAWGQLFYAGT